MTEILRVIDTHTGGEPTRVVVSGGPLLQSGSMSDRRRQLGELYDRYRSAVVNEPRGSDVMVGAWVVEPTHSGCCAGVIFFNNVGYLGMCGHGTMGVAVALGYLGRIAPGKHRLETPVGEIGFELINDNEVEFENVPARRYRANVSVELASGEKVTGDIAWGGNWFFLVQENHRSLSISSATELTTYTREIRHALTRANITGEDGSEIDHVELFGPAVDPKNHSRNFVLCPGLAYDRSPCGTGTSAKLACLASDGKLQAGEEWRQESIVGSLFSGRYRWEGTSIVPTIRGSAYVNGDVQIRLDPSDPLIWGIRA